MEILTITLPIFALIACGYLLRRRGILGPQASDFLSKFVYWAAFPALTLRSILSFDFSQTFELRLVCANLATTFVVFAVTLAFLPLLRDRRKRGVVHMGCFRTNQGYLGLPVVSGFYGDQAMSKAAVVNGFDSPLSVILSAVALELHGSMPQGSRLRFVLSRLASLFTNPLVLSALLGLALSALQVPVLQVGVLDQLLKLLADTSLPLALLSVGSSMDLRSLRRNMRPVLAVSIVKLVAMPLVAWAVGALIFGLGGMDLRINIMLTAMPSSVSSFIMAREMGADEELMAAIIGFTTFASVVTASLLQWALQTLPI